MKFKATIWKQANSYVLTVPAAYVKNGQLELEREYEVDVHGKQSE